MKRGVRIRWGYFLLIILAEFGVSQAATNYTAEETQFVQIDFASADGAVGRPCKYSFQLVNQTGFTDKIRKINASCGCSGISFGESSIPGGKSAELTLELKRESVANFRIERALVAWDSGRITQLIIARKGAFGIFVSQQTLIWNDPEALTTKSVSIYFDDKSYASIQHDAIHSVIVESTTGAVRAALERLDVTQQQMVLAITPIKSNLTTDIVRISLPPSIDPSLAFILCKINNNKL